jgi:CheY-like chemotaxis protein
VALPPLLLLTAATDIPDSAALRSAGILFAQEKPLLAVDLREAYARALGLVVPSISGAETITRPLLPEKALIVMVVEDNPTNQIVIQSMLKKLGHGCVLAVGGAEAIALYRERHREIDLVLMDCDMPDIDGYETTRQIRVYERENRLPRKAIVALTAHTLEEQIRQCREAGMDKHLAKPLGMNQLREFLQEVSDQGVS